MTIGAVAGFYGRFLDNFLMRTTDVAYAIPTLPLLIMLGSYAQDAVRAMVVIVGLLSWMATARVVRARVLTICGRWITSPRPEASVPAISG